MHAHYDLAHKYIHTYMYMYNAYIHIYIYIRIYTYKYPVFATRSYTYTRGHPRMRGPTRLPTRARAHRRSRRAQPPAPHRRPDRARPAGGGTVPGRKAAHTQCNVVTAAVFHAPMFALNADAEANACKPNHTRSTPTERARMCRRGCAGARSHTRTRARTRAQHVGACVRRARIGDPFIGVAGRAWI
jgi:hypothetical protein